MADLEIMDIGFCLDYIDEFLEQSNPEKESNRQATQADFDSF